MDWEKLRVFYHVAQCGSFTDAADRLNISQSALSRTIITLEERLNVKLFKRHKRGIALTREGDIFYKAAQKMFDEAENAKRLIYESNDEPAGPFKIATSSSLSINWLGELICDFVDKYPKIRITIDMPNDTIDNGGADVQIRPYISGRPDLVQKKLRTFELKLFASKEYIEKHGMPKKIEDESKHRFLSLAESDFFACPSIAWPVSAGRKPEAQQDPFLLVNSPELLFDYIQRGVGMGYLEANYPQSQGVHDLIEVLPHLKPVTLDVFYTYPKLAANSRRVMMLFDFLLADEK